jgi:putative tricarboxylic transport membrane protein
VVGSDKRLERYPDVPTLAEAGFQLPEVPQARGVIGPPGMSAEAVAYYQDLFETIVATPSWKEYVKDREFEPAFMRSQELARFVESYTAQIRGTLTEAGFKVVR